MLTSQHLVIGLSSSSLDGGSLSSDGSRVGEARGRKPVADHEGGFQSFHVKDPDGFNIQLSNGNRGNRRTSLRGCFARDNAPSRPARS